MSTSGGPRIARIGLAVELTNGEKIFLVSDQIAGEIEIEAKYPYENVTWGLGGGRNRHTDTSIDIHITDLKGYTLVRNAPDTTKQLDSMRAALKVDRSIAGGSSS